jgi:hypothetical protein
MSQPPPLSGSHLRTYRSIFQHPVAHNLEWRLVRALFDQIAEVVEQPNGNLRVTRNGQSLVVRPPRTKDVAEVDEVMAIRRFLRSSEEAKAIPAEAAPHWLVVINHHEARIFRSEMRGTVPERILPHDPVDFFRHAAHSQEFSRGQEKPNPNDFFEPLAETLRGSGKIVLFGGGTGTSSEREQFAAWLKQHAPDISARIIGSLPIDEHHLTEGQLLAKVRDFYAQGGALAEAGALPA